MSLSLPTRSTDPIARSLEEVRGYHALGRQSREQMRESVYGRMRAEAGRLGFGVVYMRCARTFAADYDRRRLDRLCTACKAGE
jgi:hypothetical protein